MTTTRHQMAEIIWNTSRRDEGTISATGANHVADALIAEGFGVRTRSMESVDIDVLGGVLHEAMCFMHANAYPCECNAENYRVAARAAVRRGFRQIQKEATDG